MLTERDREAFEQGMVTIDRLRALQHALEQDGWSARERSREPGMDERAGASFRGKAKAYEHAATMVNALIHGNAMHPPRWSRAGIRNRIFGAKRNAKSVSS